VRRNANLDGLVEHVRDSPNTNAFLDRLSDANVFARQYPLLSTPCCTFLFVMNTAIKVVVKRTYIEQMSNAKSDRELGRTDKNLQKYAQG